MIQNAVFGNYKNQEVHLYSLRNVNDMEVKISNYGATITSITIPADNGRDELVAGFDTLEGYFGEAYKENAPYFGCTVGRVASIIKDSSFALNGKTYALKANAGSDQLHGGPDAFDKKIWNVKVQDNSLEMSIFSPHGENGFPGNLDISVTFRLDDSNALSIKYEGRTDQDTPISLTNHTYFNLNGFKEAIHGHKAQVSASRALETDADFAPIGPVFNVTNMPSDFQEATSFSEVFEKIETGILQYYIFHDSITSLRSVANFEDEISGRKLEVLTTEPGMLLYTGYFTSNELKRENGIQYGSLRAFCCETSRCPNGVNDDKLPGTITRAGEQYLSETIYKFTF